MRQVSHCRGAERSRSRTCLASAEELRKRPFPLSRCWREFARVKLRSPKNAEITASTEAANWLLSGWLGDLRRDSRFGILDPSTDRQHFRHKPAWPPGSCAGPTGPISYLCSYFSRNVCAACAVRLEPRCCEPARTSHVHTGYQ